jgi:hypothetical protein
VTSPTTARLSRLQPCGRRRHRPLACVPRTPRSLPPCLAWVSTAEPHCRGRRRR